jgi:hypothetical protein
MALVALSECSEIALISGSPAFSMIPDRQAAQPPTFFRQFPVVPARRRAVFDESAGEPDFPIGPNCAVMRGNYCLG